MARGVRANATLLPVFSPNLQPTSLASYDPTTRRNTILVASIVPTLHQGATQALVIPADRFYAAIGAAGATSQAPAWAALNSGTTKNWDSSQKQFYANLGSFGQSGSVNFIYPLGPMGQASSYAPKNVSVTQAVMQFTARFNDNKDYTTNGIGAQGFYGATNNFSDSATHFIQVDRNSGNWELGTCDGSTISQLTGGTADANWHEFKVVWSASQVLLYVDGVLAITKTTNLPTKPLLPAAVGDTTIDIVDYLVTWEVG